MSSTLTGYGPTRNRLIYDGDEEKFELWSVKFIAHLALQGLAGVLTAATADIDAEKNAKIYAELVLVLDDNSLSLIMRDAVNDGKKALNILKEHYIGKSKPRIISLYQELTSLKMASDESVTTYVIRGETAAASLKNAGETISDSLLIAMILKGLPREFDAFTTVITQKENVLEFIKFKTMLRSYEETEKCRNGSNNSQDGVMNMVNKNIVCYKCGKPGHRKFECNTLVKNNNQNKKRWCTNCKSATHDTNYCRRKNAAKVISEPNINKDGDDSDNSHYFAFKASLDNIIYKNCDNLLVDCGATSHIINDQNKFIKFDNNFDPKSHFIELADSSRSNNVVKGRGDATVGVYDNKGVKHNFILKDALLIPSYKQDIFSVQAAVEKGAIVNFSKDDSQLVTQTGTTFDIKKEGKLYFLKSVINSKIATKTLFEWHKVLGHCNLGDILKLEKAELQGNGTVSPFSILYYLYMFRIVLLC